MAALSSASTALFLFSSVQVINEVDDEGLPLFRYVTAYVMGKEVQQKDDIDSMASVPPVSGMISRGWFATCSFLKSACHRQCTSVILEASSPRGYGLMYPYPDMLAVHSRTPPRGPPEQERDLRVWFIIPNGSDEKLSV